MKVLLGSFCICLLGCITMPNQYSALPPGPWRATLDLDQGLQLRQLQRETKVNEILPFEEVTEGQLPFNFSVTYRNDTSFTITIHNAEEDIEVNDIQFGRDRTINKDTIRINFPIFDSHIEGIFEDNVIEGRWIVHNRKDYEIHFTAFHGQDHRFSTLAKEPTHDVSGKWSVTFDPDESPGMAVAEFEQNGNTLTGTFMTPTGDYRYLEGEVQANKLYLSCFDGTHAFLFEAIIDDKGTLSGVFRSGNHWIESWVAERDENVTLPSPDTLTKISTREPVDFSFPDSNGEIVSLTDNQFNGKPKLIQILGTWCPNCYDETRFLVDFFTKNDLPIEVIALSFERHEDKEKAMAAISRYQRLMELPYPILYAGPSDKEKASEILPMISKVVSYPSLLFVDADNRIKKIHTGFSGPATSKYESFTKQFEKDIQQLINQEL